MDTFGRTLRALREAAGLSTAALGARVTYSKGYIGNLETGERRPTRAVAEACDRVLNAGGLLVELASYANEAGDDVRRRALLSGLGLLTGMGVADARVLGDAIRAGLMATLGSRISFDDWTEVCEDHGRRCMTDPPSEMHRALTGDLLLLRQQIADSDSPQLRAVAARLATLYAMTVASIGDAPGARRWYRTAKAAADTSEDHNLMAWVRGREVLRSDYDGHGRPEAILALVRDSSGIANAPVGRMEIMVAAARAYARLGEHALARDALYEARRAYDEMPAPASIDESMYYLPEWRFRLRGAFVFAMAGDIAEVEQIATDIRATRAAGPLRWGVQVELNRALAVAHNGDPDRGLALGITTVQSTPASQHTQTMRQLVSELCAAVPHGRHDDAARHLRDLVAQDG